MTGLLDWTVAKDADSAMYLTAFWRGSTLRPPYSTRKTAANHCPHRRNDGSRPPLDRRFRTAPEIEKGCDSSMAGITPPF